MFVNNALYANKQTDIDNVQCTNREEHQHEQRKKYSFFNFLNDPDLIGDTWLKLMNAYINKDSSFFQIAGKYETSPHPIRNVFVTVIGLWSNYVLTQKCLFVRNAFINFISDRVKSAGTITWLEHLYFTPTTQDVWYLHLSHAAIKAYRFSCSWYSVIVSKGSYYWGFLLLNPLGNLLNTAVEIIPLLKYPSSNETRECVDLWKHGLNYHRQAHRSHCNVLLNTPSSNETRECVDLWKHGLIIITSVMYYVDICVNDM